jgi:3-(3-hydroxy-phenyl)propionate hydroxylase
MRARERVVSELIAQRVPVLVIGAGPTGVTAATLLASYGVEALVLDRWSGVYPQPRAVHMDDEVCRIVAYLGIAEQFAKISRPGLGLRLLDDALTPLAEFKRDDACGRNGFPQANMFDQPDFEQLLRDNLADYPRVRLRGETEVIEIDTGARPGPRVTYVDRADGTEHVVQCDFLLGCDGANSITRDRIGVAMRDLKFDQRWLVMDVSTEHDLKQWDGVHQICNPRRAGTFMRIGARRYRWEFRLLDGESAADFTSLTAVRPLIQPWVGGVPDEDLDLVRVTDYTFRAQVAERWRHGSTFLLGDAAHLTPPFIGQGMGAGLRDAMNLAWKLAGVLHGDLPEAVLDSYETERKPHARQMIQLARGIGLAMTGGGDVGNLIRRVVVPRLHYVPGLRRRVVDSVTPPLRRSVLIQKDRTPRRQLAGTLILNPVQPDGRRLDAWLGHGFAIVTAGPVAQSDAMLAAGRGAVVVTAEAGSELARWLHRGRAAAAVIRPDRTVMATGSVGAMCAAVPSFTGTRVRTSRG